MLTLGVMSLSAYPLMVFLVSKVSKRDLEEEQRIRDEKRKERKAKGGGPPIMNRDGFYFLPFTKSWRVIRLTNNLADHALHVPAECHNIVPLPA